MLSVAASEPLARLRGFSLFDGARGDRPVDLDELTDVAAAVGNLLAGTPGTPGMPGSDRTPSLATPSGAAEVAWMFTWGTGRGR